ncbi:hypothetical protein BH09SUM1_BH09SUM1_00670 [soil metagenome]
MRSNRPRKVVPGEPIWTPIADRRSDRHHCGGLFFCNRKNIERLLTLGSSFAPNAVREHYTGQSAPFEWCAFMICCTSLLQDFEQLDPKIGVGVVCLEVRVDLRGGLVEFHPVAVGQPLVVLVRDEAVEICVHHLVEAVLDRRYPLRETIKLLPVSELVVLRVRQASSDPPEDLIIEMQPTQGLGEGCIDLVLAGAQARFSTILLPKPSSLRMHSKILFRSHDWEFRLARV